MTLKTHYRIHLFDVDMSGNMYVKLFALAHGLCAYLLAFVFYFVQSQDLSPEDVPPNELEAHFHQCFLLCMK